MDFDSLSVRDSSTQVNRGLTSLYLANNYLGPEGALALAEALEARPSPLTELVLVRNSIGAAAAEEVGLGRLRQRASSETRSRRSRQFWIPGCSEHEVSITVNRKEVAGYAGFP